MFEQERHELLFEKLILIRQWRSQQLRQFDEAVSDGTTDLYALIGPAVLKAWETFLKVR